MGKRSDVFYGKESSRAQPMMLKVPVPGNCIGVKTNSAYQFAEGTKAKSSSMSRESMNS